MGLEVRSGDELVGSAIVRPEQGMDFIDFIYARSGPDRSELFDSLLEWCCGRLASTGLTRIVYAAFAYWRKESFPKDLSGAFLRRGFSTYRAVYLGHPLDPPPAVTPIAPGYEVHLFADDRVEEAARMMLRCPEPEAIYWDHGLCTRSIEGAAAPTLPRFPHGLGQMVVWRDWAGSADRCSETAGAPATAGSTVSRDGVAPIVAFSLATLSGYVNHVYTLPEHRSKGLASSVITRVLQAVHGRGHKRATILTHETNPGAIRLYQRLGFRTLFTYPQFFVRR
ncbi:GNAT family N-acetyltransferase [Planctomycetota bacterium]